MKELTEEVSRRIAEERGHSKRCQGELLRQEEKGKRAALRIGIELHMYGCMRCKELLIVAVPEPTPVAFCNAVARGTSYQAVQSMDRLMHYTKADMGMVLKDNEEWLILVAIYDAS